MFSRDELAYAMKSQKKWERLAVRFAAKEAVWKALGVGGLGLKDISIKRSGNGMPFVDLKELGLPKNRKASLSLSHSDNYAVAYCLVYRE
ncbi:MAG: 4'-phosphopantetheinyl transferase superfamily protein [Elusimicrobia bacterium]|nr:4'-phosphopantetheinyl transferase superfamily protein [Elusimicrobiota bacterium]